MRVSGIGEQLLCRGCMVAVAICVAGCQLVNLHLPLFSARGHHRVTCVACSVARSVRVIH